MIMRIKELRSKAEMNQTQLASAMGVAQTTVSQWEIEVALPRTRQLPDLARVLGVGIGDLFTEDPHSPPGNYTADWRDRP